MRYVADRSYLAPDVYDAGDGYLVMDRVPGQTMLASSLSHPDRIAAYGQLRAQLRRSPPPPSPACASRG